MGFFDKIKDTVKTFKDDGEEKQIGASMYHDGAEFPELETAMVRRGWRLAEAKEHQNVRRVKRMKEEAAILKEEVKINKLKAQNAKANKVINDNKSSDGW